MEAIGLAGEENAGRRLSVLRAIDKLDRLGPEGVAALLGHGRKDDSGDFTKGAGLGDEAVATVLRFLDIVPSASGDATGPRWEKIKSGLDPASADQQLTWLRQIMADTPVGTQGAQELSAIAELIRAAGYSDRVQIDPSVVRGLEYYTGPVFEAQLTFEVPGEDGKPVVFGSVGGGGRYDGLVGRFRGEDVPATGFSVGVSRLASALKAIGKLGREGAFGPVVVTVMDRDKLADYQRMVSDLRNAGIAAEMYLGASGMKAQLKYADRRNAPAAIIAGSSEFERGMVQVKDLVAGKEQAAQLADNQAWREARPGQFEVPLDGLVAAVRELIARQKGG
jgi:histidyl-tRNA synthetase